MRIVILKSETTIYEKKYILISGKLPYTRTCHVKGFPVSKFTSLQIKISDIQTKLELGTLYSKMGLMILERRRKL